MKILHVSPSYYPALFVGGPVLSVYSLNNALARLPEISLRILTTDLAGPDLAVRLHPDELQDLYPSQEVLFARRVPGRGYSVELLRKLPQLIRWADVVHITAAYSFSTIPALAICRLFDRPVVWSPRGALLEASEWENARRRRLKWAWDLVCNALVRPGRVVMHTTAERELNATLKRLPRASAVIVPNGVEVPEIDRGREWRPDGRLRLMYLGRLSPIKGIENLISAMSLIGNQDVALRIYGAGDHGYTSKLEGLARNLGLLGRSVFFSGNVSGDEKREAFRSADVCVVPSFTENFCMVVAEALAHGIPVIASKGTPWEKLEERACGFWVDNSPESLSRAINGIRDMDFKEMGSRGREWMLKDFSWDSIASGMMGVYKELA